MRTRLVVIISIVIIGFLSIMTILNRRTQKLTVTQEAAEEKETAVLADILNQAVQKEHNGNLVEARDLFEKLVSDFPNSADVSDWQDKIWDINIKLLFSPTITDSDINYEIKRGDSLVKIAKKHNTTVELLKKSNNLSSNVIIAGRRLKVRTKPFNIVIDKSQNRLILKSNDEVIKVYTVSTGINNSTPVGTFKIVNKLVNPSWYKAGAVVPAESPDNILGSRWMGFDLKGYGIHGTVDPGSLGQQVTQGCVRMSNSDVEELFSIVPTKTEVTIVN